MTKATTTNKVDGFQYTTAIKKLRKLTKRIRVVPGGSSGGKTYGIIPILIDTAARTPNLEISIVSETVPHLRKGALKDFLKIMKATGRYNDANYNRTLLTYTFSNGSYIEFFSVDQEDKVRGPRRDILYINEANNVSFETYHQLAIRTAQTIWLDFNPANEFWVHTELADDPRTEWLTLTYKDNEALTQSIVEELEAALYKAFYNPNLEPDKLFEPDNIKNFYWSNWWKVYGLGLLGTLEGVIFTNWKQVDSIPREARLLGYGMDFGFTNDPTTLVGAYEYEGKIYWDEVIYQKGLTNNDIAKKLKDAGVDSHDLIVADSADPKTIYELSKYGFNIIAAEKGPDSIVFGIGLLQEEEFYVTKRSLNLINELRKYMWAKNKEGKTLNIPVDAFNHLIDGMRYLANNRLARYTKRRGPRRRN